MNDLIKYQGIKDYIIDNLHLCTNIEKLANDVGINKREFCRKFKTYYKKTPKQFIKDLRLERLDKWLKQGKEYWRGGSSFGNSLGFKTDEAFYKFILRERGLKMTDILEK